MGDFCDVWAAHAGCRVQARLREVHMLERCAGEDGILWVETPRHGLGEAQKLRFTQRS